MKKHYSQCEAYEQPGCMADFDALPDRAACCHGKYTVVVSTMLSVLFVSIPLPPVAHFQFISIASFNLVVPIIMIRNTITITTMSFPMVSDVHDDVNKLLIVTKQSSGA